MSDLQAIADRFEIEPLRGEFTGALMMRDYAGRGSGAGFTGRGDERAAPAGIRAAQCDL